MKNAQQILSDPVLEGIIAQEDKKICDSIREIIKKQKPINTSTSQTSIDTDEIKKIQESIQTQDL